MKLLNERELKLAGVALKEGLKSTDIDPMEFAKFKAALNTFGDIGEISIDDMDGLTVLSTESEYGTFNFISIGGPGVGFDQGST